MIGAISKTDVEIGVYSAVCVHDSFALAQLKDGDRFTAAAEQSMLLTEGTQRTVRLTL